MEEKMLAREDLEINTDVNAKGLNTAAVEELILLKYDNEFDKPLLVMKNSATGRYSIIDGQHLFTAKDDKDRWLCKVKDGDASDPDDAFKALALSYKANSSQRSLTYAESCVVVHRYEEHFIKEHGSNYGYTKYIAEKLGISRGASANNTSDYKRLVKNGLLEKAIKGNWVRTTIKIRCYEDETGESGTPASSYCPEGVKKKDWVGNKPIVNLVNERITCVKVDVDELEDGKSYVYHSNTNRIVLDDEVFEEE